MRPFRLLPLFALACSDKGGSGDTGALDPVTGSEDAAWFCDDGDYTVVDGELRTEHYTLHIELADEAPELGMLAEATYAALAEYFDAEPFEDTLRAGWYADYAAYVAAVEADGTAAPEAGGYYWPGSKTAYMYTQPTRYFSRMLFIHELTHQFHFLARTGNDSRAAWYVEGLAEYLSRHDWDDGCVRLGRLPMLTWEDYPAVALDEGTYDFDGTGDLSRPWAWATTRYLQQEQSEAFDAFRDAVDADGTTLLADYVDVGETVAAVEAWLPAEQEPLTPVFLDWLHVSEGVVEGESVYLTMAVAKQGGDFAARHAAPAGAAGILAGYDDSGNYSAWLVDAAGSVWTFVSIGGSATWWGQGGVTPAEAYDWTLSGTTVTLNGQAFEETNGFASRGGVVVNADALRFEDVTLP